MDRMNSMAEPAKMMMSLMAAISSGILCFYDEHDAGVLGARFVATRDVRAVARAAGIHRDSRASALLKNLRNCAS